MLKPLHYIVHQVMSDLQESDTGNYEKYLQWAIFCCTTELHMKYSDKIKVLYLTMSDIKTIPYPIDYYSYIAIGICYKGQVITLTRNDKLCLPRKTDDCGNIEAVMSGCGCGSAEVSSLVNRFGYHPFASHWRGGQYVGEMYGIGGGFNSAYYRDDVQNQQFVFSGNVPNGEVVLEYKASGIEPDGSMLVDVKILAAIREYIHWQRTRFKAADSRPALGDKRDQQQNYINELEKLADMKCAFTVDEYLDMHYRTTGGIKR